MREKVKVGNWIDKNGEFYKVYMVTKNGCHAIKINLRPSGTYKTTGECVFFTNEELKRLLICQY